MTQPTIARVLIAKTVASVPSTNFARSIIPSQYDTEGMKWAKADWFLSNYKGSTNEPAYLTARRERNEAENWKFAEEAKLRAAKMNTTALGEAYSNALWVVSGGKKGSRRLSDQEASDRQARENQEKAAAPILAAQATYVDMYRTLLSEPSYYRNAVLTRVQSMTKAQKKPLYDMSVTSCTNTYREKIANKKSNYRIDTGVAYYLAPDYQTPRIEEYVRKSILTPEEDKEITRIDMKAREEQDVRDLLAAAKGEADREAIRNAEVNRYIAAGEVVALNLKQHDERMIAQLAAQDSKYRLAMDEFGDMIDFCNTVSTVSGVVINALPDIAVAVMVFIPGVGPALSIAASLALSLARGRPLTAAVVDAISSMVPGGILGQAVFRVGEGICSGRSLEEIGIGALPIPAEAKQQLTAYTSVIRDITAGKTLGDVVLGNSLSMLPDASKLAAEAAAKLGVGQYIATLQKQIAGYITPEMRKAFEEALQTGLSVSQAKYIQEITEKVVQGVDFLRMLEEKGAAFITGNSALKYGQTLVPDAAKRGYDLGVAIMNYQVSPSDIIAVRKILSDAEKAAFDSGMAIVVGKHLAATGQDVMSLYEAAQKLQEAKANPPVSIVKAKGAASFQPKTSITAIASPAKTVVDNVKGLKDPVAVSSYYIARGLSASTRNTDIKANVLTQFANNPAAIPGIKLAIVQKKKEEQTILEWLLSLFGL